MLCGLGPAPGSEAEANVDEVHVASFQRMLNIIDNDDAGPVERRHRLATALVQAVCQSSLSFLT